jgi:adenine-specific DNA-methyltransferase
LGNRKFILCTNNENNICEEVTYERVKRVIKGYKNKKDEKVTGLGGNLRYYKTDLVDIERLQNTPDQSKVKLTYQAGEMIGLRENTLNEVEKNEWWQIFEGNGKLSAIYFKEDKEKLSDLVELLEKKNKPTALYIFSWGKNEYKSEYSSQNIRVEDIPEPILEVYKEINRL